MKSRLLASMLILAFTMTFVSVAIAEYPEKPLELIVQSSPGGGSDLFCRSLADIHL